MHDFAEQLVELRPMLVRMARRRLHNEAWVEDAVSETLVAALENPAAFGGRAKVRTWVVGILKHKVVDQIRRHTRECQLDAPEDEAPDFDAAAAESVESLGEAPADWGDPQERLAQRQFMAQFDRAVRTLPRQQGRAFMMRNWMDADTDHICHELGVTANHLAVMLHRARHKLRAALQTHALPAAA